MKLEKHRWWLFLIALVLVISTAGCASKVIVEEKKPSNLSYAWVGFPQPCPTPQDAKILIEKTSPRVVKPGQLVEIKISIKNNEQYPIDKITIEEKMPVGLDVRSITPKPSSSGDGIYVWNMEKIKPRQQKTITITGKTNKTGTVRYTANTILNFEVSGKPEGESVVAVVAPGLGLELETPSIAVINEKIPVVFTIKNTGSAEVKGAKIVHTLPPGLLTYVGRSKIEITVGDIDTEQSKQYGYYLKGTQKGNYKTTFTAVAQGGLSASATMNLRITLPQLNIKMDAPKKRFVGDFISYKIDIKNVGDSVASNPVVSLALPEGVSLSSVNENGDVAQNQVTWDMESIHPGQTKTFIAKVVAKKISTARAVATVKLGSTEEESAVTTDIAGISALLCKLIDKNDPVPVGDNEIYELTATNQGSLPATKIKLTCYLEDSMEYVKSSGATKGSLNGNTLTFEQLPLLEPQADAKWRIVVKAVKSGDVRFKAEVISDQLSRPVELVEPTHFYE